VMVKRLLKYNKKAFDFKKKLITYADLLLSLGVNLKKGEYCLIQALTVHRELALACAEAAYKKGASYVHILYLDELLDSLRLKFASRENLTYFSSTLIKAYEEVLENQGVFLSFTGREDLTTYENIDPERSNALLLARAEKLGFFYEKVRANALKWCVAASATIGLAAKLFPKLRPEKATVALWEEFFTICRINTPDPALSWQEHLDRLNSITQRLNALKIRELEFKGKHLDLKIGLSEQARWKGGESFSEKGEKFLPNIPTEEVFTVPDFHRVNGWVECSRPLVYRNFYVEKIRLEFKDGTLIKIGGSKGIENLRKYIFASPENNRLGEVALVESTSPIFKSGHVFHNLLYDENAASHIAFGGAYPECFEGIEKYGTEEMDKLGFNQSKIHIDLMIGSPDVTVKAYSATGREILLTREGRFII
jgi:aminopeptidase